MYIEFMFVIFIICLCCLYCVLMWFVVVVIVIGMFYVCVVDNVVLMCMVEV